MPNLGPPELFIILIIVFVIFGAGKLPEIGGALGKGLREFRNAGKEVDAAKSEVESAAGDLKKAATSKLEGAKQQVEATTKEVKEAVASEVADLEPSEKA